MPDDAWFFLAGSKVSDPEDPNYLNGIIDGSGYANGTYYYDNGLHQPSDVEGGSGWFYQAPTDVADYLTFYRSNNENFGIYDSDDDDLSLVCFMPFA